MVAINKILAKRVKELTELLADVRESTSDIGADEIVEQIDEVIGTEEEDSETTGRSLNRNQETTLKKRSKQAALHHSGV